MTRRIVSILGVAPFLLAFMLGAACASYPPPTDAVANALASMRGAEELGASRVPQAELQLQLADEELKRARQLMADGENERAHYMAVRAANDAELAIALTREAQAKTAAEQARQRVEATTPPQTQLSAPAVNTPEVQP
mgnify:CR=1 FL=1|jgi:hypothetical protein